METIGGHNNLVSSSFADGTNSSNALYYCLQMGTRTDYDMKIVSRETWREIESMAWRLRIDGNPMITVYVRCWHPAGVLLSSDASSSFENPTVDGELVCNTLMGRPLTALARSALEQGKILINRLELLWMSDSPSLKEKAANL